MITIKHITACFTGHRKIPFMHKNKIKKRLFEVIEDLIKEGYLYFGAGGALGFDTIAAQVVLELRKKYPQIKLILVLPCRDQTKNWKDCDISTYEQIKQQADKVVYTSEKYTKDCMYKRNRHLINNSSVCVCYLTENQGGTYYTVEYAKHEELRVIDIKYKL